MNNIYRRWVKQHVEVGIKPFGWAASEEKKSFQLNTKQFSTICYYLLRNRTTVLLSMQGCISQRLIESSRDSTSHHRKTRPG